MAFKDFITAIILREIPVTKKTKKTTNDNEPEHSTPAGNIFGTLTPAVAKIADDNVKRIVDFVFA